MGLKGKDGTAWDKTRAVPSSYMRVFSGVHRLCFVAQSTKTSKTQINNITFCIIKSLPVHVRNEVIDMVRDYAKKIQNMTIGIGRKIYYKQLRKKLKNTRPTIIACNCIGTLIYHNLGLKFYSPTINLFFSKKDFIIFVKDLSGFLHSELMEVEDPSTSYPVGKLEYNGNSIRIDFVHYKTFEEAKYKWDERKERVNYSDIYVIQMIADDLTEDDISDFENLPYKNKMLITNKNITNSKNIVTNEVFSKKNYYPGKILAFKSWLSFRRYMDDIDYVGFLNAGIEN